MTMLARTSGTDVGLRLVTRLWAVAVLAHLVGNTRWGTVLGMDGPLQALSVLLAGSAAMWLARPHDRRLAVAVPVLTICVAIAEAPVIPNHWLVAVAISLVALVSRGWTNSERFWSHFAPGARAVLLIFYSFAAFAKLNTGFLDPVVSCAVYYGNHMLTSFGLPELSTGTAVAGSLGIGSALIELSVPVLLCIRRTRRVGVLLAVCFHTFVSYDLDQHFFDFTAVLIPLFLLFMPPESLATLHDRLSERFGHRARIPVVVAAVLAIMALLANVSPNAVPGPPAGIVVDVVPFVLWIPFTLLLVVELFRLSWTGGALPRRIEPAVAVVAALLVFNGLTPYLELKHAYGFNMYSNLRTVDGTSNHLIVRRTLPLTDAQRDPVTILASPDPALAPYVLNGDEIPVQNLAAYLSKHPDTPLTIRQNGVEQTLERASQRPDLVQPVSWWRRRFQVFRPIPAADPPRCQVLWYPAAL